MTAPRQTFGQRAAAALFDLFSEAKLSGQPGAMARENMEPKMVALLDDLAARHKIAQKSKTPAERTAEMDEIWLAELEANPTYRGIDVRRELGKAQAWASVNPGHEITRKRFVNWLNRATRDQSPLSINGAGATSYTTNKPGAPFAEPTGWRNILLRLYPTLDRAALAQKTWADLSPTLRSDVEKATR